jgi:hypothetical protein
LLSRKPAIKNKETKLFIDHEGLMMKWVMALVVAFCAATATAQCVTVEPPRGILKILKNQSQMKVSFSFDRTTPYFPGEAMKILIVTANPTASTLEVLEPGEAAFFETGTEDCGNWPLSSLRTVIVGPGQTIRRVIDSQNEDASARSFLPKSVPCEPGTYRLALHYAPMEAPRPYQVGVPVLEASAVVWVDRHQHRQSERVAVPIVAAQLNAPGEQPPHVLVVAPRGEPEGIRVATGRGQVLRPCRFGSWIRLLNVPNEITSLTANVDSRGRMKIEYADKAGTQSSLSLDAKLRPIPTR